MSDINNSHKPAITEMDLNLLQFIYIVAALGRWRQSDGSLGTQGTLESVFGVLRVIQN